MPAEDSGIKYGNGAYLTDMDDYPGDNCLVTTSKLGGKGLLLGKLK